MAQTAVDIVVKVVGEGKLKRLDSSLKGTAANSVKAAAGLDKTAVGARNAGRAAGSAANGVDKLNKAFGVITVALGAVTSAVAAFNTSISRTESERKIQILGEAYGEAGALAKFASESADTFGQSQTEVNNALAKTYARLRPVGVGLEDIVSTYNGFQTAARLSGTSARESAAAFTQLAQALGSGRLAGDEFRSIAEQAPLVLQAISKETGIAVGQLKQFAADGNLTADVVIKALKRIETEGAGDLAETLKGPAQAFANLRNAAEDLFADLGKLGEGVLVEAVNAITSGIKTIKENLDLLGPLFQNVFSVLTAVGRGFAEGFTQVTGSVTNFGATTRQVLAVVAVVLGDLAKVVQSVFTFIGTIVGNIVKFVGSALNAVVGNVAEAGQGIVQNVSTTVRSVAKLISDLVNAISGLGGVLLDKVFGINLGDVVTGPLNALADGIDGVAASVGNYITSVKERAAELNFGGGILPEGIDGLAGSTLTSPDPDGDKKGGKKGRGGKSDAERELERQLKLQEQLLKGAQDLLFAAQEENKALQGQTEYETALLEASKAANEIKREYAEKLLEAKEITDAAVRSEVELTLQKAQGLELTNNDLELQQEIADLRDSAIGSITDEIELLEAKLEGTEEELKMRREIAKLTENGSVSNAEATALVERKNALENLVEKQKELKEMTTQVASTISSAFTSAFRSVIDGSKSAQEALSDAFTQIGNSFVDMALKIIEQQLTMIMQGLLMKALGISMPGSGAGLPGGGGFGAGAGSFSTGGGIFNTPFATFADGGFPPVGKPSIVGEEGPEIFIPQERGLVLPNDIFEATKEALETDGEVVPAEEAEQTEAALAANNSNISNTALQHAALANTTTTPLTQPLLKKLKHLVANSTNSAAINNKIEQEAIKPTDSIEIN